MRGGFGIAIVTAAALTAASPAFASERMPHDWTGFYIGAHAGWGASEITYYDPAFPNWSLRHRPTGFVGGGQAGLNVQFQSLVLGVEGDIAGALMENRVFDYQPGFVNDRFETDMKWIGIVAGRAGLAFGPLLVYAKSGAIWAKSEHQFQFAQAPGFGPATLTATRHGWTIGGGFEYALTPNWSAKAEYNYADFGQSKLMTFQPLPDGFSASFAQDLHIVKGGLNYRFGR